MEGDYDTFAAGLADNGAPLLPPGNPDRERLRALVDKLKEKMAGDTNLEIKILKEIQSQALKLGPATVELQNQMTIVERSRNGGVYGPIEIRQTQIVRIPLQGSREIVKKYSLSATSLTLNAERELVVYLIKVGDRWYWNPFGW